LGLLIPLLLGVGFYVLALNTKDPGFSIPAGVLSGVGLGVLMVNNPVTKLLNLNTGGIFLICMALGFASIDIFTRSVLHSEQNKWAQFPSLLLGILGTGISIGGIFLKIVSLLGRFWPLILIIIGLKLIYSESKPIKKTEKEG